MQVSSAVRVTRLPFVKLFYVAALVALVAPAQAGQLKIVVQAADIGIKPGLEYNWTARLNAWLKTHSNQTIQFTEGIYILDHVLVENRGIRLEGKKTVFQTGRKQEKWKGLVDITGSYCSVSNLQIIGFGNDSLQAGINVAGAGHVSISHVDVSQVKLHGINIEFSSDVQVEFCSVNHCYNGIQFWGGDSKDHQGPGLKNIRVSNCRVSDMAEGGIWGSMGNNIVFSGNQVTGCRDVGLDLEGCTHSQIIKNSVSNCTNGCITLFYGSQYIDIRQNSIKPAAGQTGIKFYNSKYLNGNITVADNSIAGHDMLAILLDEKAAQKVTITGNYISGSSSSGIRAILCDAIYVLKNQILLHAAAFGISNEGGSAWKIVGNVINEAPDKSADRPVSKGLNIYWKSHEHPADRNSVLNNKISGFDASVFDDSWGEPSRPENQYTGNFLESFYQPRSRPPDALTLKSNTRTAAAGSKILPRGSKKANETQNYRDIFH